MSSIKKFVAIGPESTGKSTLCKTLAEAFHTLWCPEYAREFLEVNGHAYTYHDLLTIAQGQITLEEKTIHEAEAAGKKIIFIDTDMYVMKVWCEYVFNKCHPFILNQIAQRKYDGYFLCHPDLPWEKDPLREYPQQEIRQELFFYYKELMTSQPTPWCDIFGNHDERLSKAKYFVKSHVALA